MPGFGPGDIEQGAIGEGFGDFFAGMYYLEPRQRRPTSRPAATASATGTPSPTTRSAARTTAAAACAGSTAPTRAAARTSASTPGRPTEVHDDGRYWSAAMTCIFEGLGGNVAGPQQRPAAGHRPQRAARPDRRQQRLRGLGRRAPGRRPEPARRRPHRADQQLRVRPPADRHPAPLATRPRRRSRRSSTRRPPDGANGFYRGDVGVTWQVSDGESSVTTSGCDPTTINSDTPGPRSPAPRPAPAA